ncbi:hypothetical protein Tco_1127813 [Tanacetum coccineum]
MMVKKVRGLEIKQEVVEAVKEVAKVAKEVVEVAKVAKEVVEMAKKVIRVVKEVVEVTERMEVVVESLTLLVSLLSNDNVINDNNQGNVRTVNMNNSRGGCSYKEFMACNPKGYDGKGSAIVYTRWIEKMESVQDMSGCEENQKVKYTAISCNTPKSG